MTPSEAELTLGVDAAARAVYAASVPRTPGGGPVFDDLDPLAKNSIRESVLPILWAGLNVLPDRRTSLAAEIEAIADALEKWNTPTDRGGESLVLNTLTRRMRELVDRIRTETA